MKVDPNDLPPGYVPQEFPKMKHHPKLGQKVVFDPKEEKALGKGWFDSEQEMDIATGKTVVKEDLTADADLAPDNDPPLAGDAPPMNKAFPKRDDGGDLDPNAPSINDPPSA